MQFSRLTQLEGYYTIGPTEQYLISTGRTFFKGMTYSHMRRLQFDLSVMALDPAIAISSWSRSSIASLEQAMLEAMGKLVRANRDQLYRTWPGSMGSLMRGVGAAQPGYPQP